jgi:hypothetical protein
MFVLGTKTHRNAQALYKPQASMVGLPAEFDCGSLTLFMFRWHTKEMNILGTYNELTIRKEVTRERI